MSAGLAAAALALSVNAAAQTASQGTWQMPATTPAEAPPPPPYPGPPYPPPAYPPPAYRPQAHPQAPPPQHGHYPQDGYPYATPYPAPAGPAAAPAPPDVSEDEEPSPPFFDLALGTYVPLSLGGQASLELPARLLLQLDVGWMPPAYGSAINGLVQALGGYDPAIGELVDGALRDAVVVRVSGGWRPFPSAGFEIYGGYTHVGLSGSVSPSAVANIVGGDFADQVAEELLTSDVDVSSKLHNFHVALGWRWVAFDHLVIRATVGYTQTVGSSTSVETPDRPEAAALANPVVDARMTEVYTTYVKLPVVGLSGGYRF